MIVEAFATTFRLCRIMILGILSVIKWAVLFRCFVLFTYASYGLILVVRKYPADVLIDARKNY